MKFQGPLLIKVFTFEMIFDVLATPGKTPIAEAIEFQGVSGSTRVSRDI